RICCNLPETACVRPCTVVGNPQTHMRDIIRHLPARLLTPEERALVVEWFAAAGDIAEAYVSNRRGDDPALHHRVVVITKPDMGPSHLIHAPAGRDIWVVFSLGS